MNKIHVDTLWEAVLALVVTLFENGVLYVILFYAIFKTATSMEDEKAISRWLKYWICYGVISFFCACISHGTLVKAILCGLLLLKFNDFIILNSVYDNVLSKVLTYSRHSLESLLQAVVYNAFKVVEFVHWSVISTFNQSEAMLEASDSRLTETKQVIRKAEQKQWKEGAPTIQPAGVKTPSKSEDSDDVYERLSRTCVLPRATQTFSMDEPSFEATDGIRRRK
ncbi:hypothetical protein WA577_001933 [Blastocystis sp. JDR]